MSYNKRIMVLVAQIIFFVATIFFLLQQEVILVWITFFLFAVLAFSQTRILEAQGNEIDQAMQECLQQEAEQKTEEQEQKIKELTEQLENQNQVFGALTARKTELEEELKRMCFVSEELQQEEKQEIDADYLLLPQQEEKVKTDVLAILKKSVDRLKGCADQQGIQIQVTEPAEEIMLKADARQLEILFHNIIDNAIKYMNKSGVLFITMTLIEGEIFIIFKDSGKGLSESETEHVFELNYQGSNRISGNGLGLAQSWAIVKSYGGTISARSTVGNGMGIFIHIPTEQPL